MRGKRPARPVFFLESILRNPCFLAAPNPPSARGNVLILSKDALILANVGVEVEDERKVLNIASLNRITPPSKSMKRLSLFVFAALCAGTVFAQSPWERIAQMPSTLGIEKGSKTFTTSDFYLEILNSSHTAAALSPVKDTTFDYTPDERLKQRDKDGFYHLGDINLRYRIQGNEAWTAFSSAKKRTDVQMIAPEKNTLAGADLSGLLEVGAPLTLKRFWEKQGENLVLRFEIRNTSGAALEIGSLGIPMIFNNILQDKKLDDAHTDNVFFDPYIGRDAGYLQVNRLHGKGASLLVLPYENAGFEAYNPVNDDPTPRSIVFEGFHEWMIHSKAHAETDWKGVEQWNEPTSAILKPGEARSFSLKFVFAPSIREIEAQLEKEGRPVAVGLPGYMLPQNENATLHLKYGKKVASVKVFPEGSLEVKRLGKKGKWERYAVHGLRWGRARLTVNYKDGTVQTVHYKVIKSQEEVVKDLGNFLTTKQWFDDKDDPFGRAPSIITYDIEEQKQVTQEQRAWYAGLSDEAGAASWLAAFMKQSLVQDKEEVEKLKRFARETLWGGIQYSEGEYKYGVKKSLFYYEPDSMPKGTYREDINWKVWSAWPKKEADKPGRSYNYPHVAAAHWVLYRLARNHEGLAEDVNWRESLQNAYHTAIAMVNLAPYYAQFGQMEGSVFLYILEDLKREGILDMAHDLEAAMKKRADHWKTLGYPFGSEMPWDSTGQEEVYMWSKYFGNTDKAEVTLNAILAYMPTVPHWGYNGSARRYWDFVYGGKLSRIERQLHHYGSALNSIPVSDAYRDNPDDFYLLRVGHAGAMGALANVTQEGYGPAAFHSYPSTLEIDGITGDYGSGFYGYAVNSGTYITVHPEFGPVAFSGNISGKGKWLNTEITSGGKSRVYLAPEKLWITLDAGRVSSLNYNRSTREVELVLEPADEFTKMAYVRLEGPYQITAPKDSRGNYTVPLSGEKTVLKLSR